MGAKKPQVAVEPKPAKRPIRAVPDPDEVVKHEPLSWGYRFLDLGGEWGWRKLSPDHAEKLRRELVDVEGRKLIDLMRGRKIKEIPVADMKVKAQERLKQTGFEEADTLYEIRLPDKWRVWGLMERAVFCLLWWDEFETACGHLPKGKARQR
jgi:hypothetical protein